MTGKTGTKEYSDENYNSPVIGDHKPRKVSTSMPFLDQNIKPVSFSDASNWTHADQWDTIICPDILVSRKELLLLLAEKLRTTRNLRGMKMVAKCITSVDRHVTVATVSNMNLHYWGSGTYNCVGRRSAKWQTWVEVEGYDRVGSSKRRHFGSTPDAQEKLKELNLRAWYDLIQVTNIKNYANVQKDPDPYLDGEVFLQSCVWS